MEFDPDDAEAVEQRVVHPVAAGERAGVAQGQLGAELGIAGLERDDRLAGLHRLGGGPAEGRRRR